MKREGIDWAGQFQEAHVSDPENLLNEIDYFLQLATTELAPLHISDAVRASVEAAGCRIKGNTYFNNLFSDAPDITQIERVKSAFVGTVAHGRGDLATEAYALLAASDTSDNHEVLNGELVGRLTKSMRYERWSGGYERLERLEGAAKALGQPFYRRILGGLATGFAMHAS